MAGPARGRRTPWIALVAGLWAVSFGIRSAAQPHRHVAPARARMIVSPLDLTDADLAAGRRLFTSRCAKCHGADGKGDDAVDQGGTGASDLTAADLRHHADGDLFWVITHGVVDTDMPAFARKLSDVQRWQLVAHIRMLSGATLETRSSRDGAPAYVWELPNGFPRPRVPPDNPMSAAKVELGRHLFYDTRLSVNQTVSCATCHKQSLAFTDGLARSVGATQQAHPRSAMGLANVAYAPVLTWANPSQRKLEMQALVPMFGEEPVEMGLSGYEIELFVRLSMVPTYRQLFRAAFPGDEQPFTLLNLTRALASFERTLISGRSPYDRYRTAEDPSALSASAKRGEALFFDERTECFHCHGGFNLTETVDHVGKSFVEVEFHNTGLYNLGADGAYPAPNTGVHAVTEDPEDMGRFKAPSLRNVALTAPYMRDGSMATLDEVIAHYEAGGRTIADGPNRGVGADNPHKSSFVKGFTLTPQERADLKAFLESLTDAAFVSDPRFSNPWPKGASDRR